MSLPPSTRSKNLSAPYGSWQEIIKFAGGLSILPGIESLLIYGSEGLESLFSTKTKIYLSEVFSQQFNNTEKLANILIDKSTSLMDQAIQNKVVALDSPQNSIPAGMPLIIALPLIAQEKILGAIQLTKTTQAGFSSDDIHIIQTLVAQFSIGLQCMLLGNRVNSLQSNIGQITQIEEISQSILSNLDRDSLINGVISLLHQVYGYSIVNIYTSRSGDKTVLRKMGISTNGIENETKYYFERDTGPVGWCVSHGDPVVVNDTSTDSRYPVDIFDNSIRSVLILPLFQGDLFIGVLELASNSVSAFIPEAVELLELLADKITVAIRNANLYRSEQVKRIIAERLHDAIGAVTVEVSSEDVYNQIFDEMELFLPWDAAAIWLRIPLGDEIEDNQPENSFYLAAARSKNPDNSELLDRYIQNPDDAKELITANTWISKVAEAKIPMIRSASASFEPIGTLLGFDNQYSAVATPLVINNQVIGLLASIDHQADQYDEESLTIVEAFAAYSAKAIENVRLYKASHDQAWITTVLVQVIEATQSITNMDELISTSVSILPDLLSVNACIIFLWDPSIEAFYSRASNGFDADQATRLDQWDITSKAVTAFEDVKENRIPTILNSANIPADVATAIFPDYDFDKDLMILFPLLTQNIFCGALLVDFSDSDLDISSSQDVWDEKYALIEGAAHQVAVAIENLQLIKSQEEEAYISVALLQVAQAVVSLSQLDEILSTIVRITPILVGVKRCVIYIWDGKEQVYRQSQYFGFSKNDLALMGQVIKTDEFPLIETIQKTDRITYHALRSQDSPASWIEMDVEGNYEIESNAIDSGEEITIRLDERALVNRQRLLIGFPLSVKGENLGAMLIEEEDPARGLPSVHIREKRIEIVKGITQQAAIAIKNELLQQEAVKSERMERELQLAREIQATFLPETLPTFPGWDIDVRWQPARQVGGDFYDFLQLDENRIGFVIADVADKGMPAALFMTLIRTLIRAAAKEKSSPSAVLKQVNELLIPDAKHGMFVTIFYCVIDLQSGLMVYANAGHNPPIIKRRINTELVELARTSIAIGLFYDIEVEEKELFINPGDWIMFYTDGVTEAFSASDEMFGKDRLFDLLTSVQFDSSKVLLDMVEQTVSEFIQGTDISDDITLAVLSRIIEKN